MENFRFTEQQNFRQLWIWIILFLFSGFVLYVTYKQLYLNEPFGDNLLTNFQLLIAILAMLGVVALFIFSKLETIVDGIGVQYRFYPFIPKFKVRKWGEIREAKVRKYNPIVEYGGWGICLGIFGKGRALNVSGNMGLQLVFTNGKRLLIGTNKPDELVQVLLHLRKP